MALIDQISSATATAMKAGQADRVAVLRLLSNSLTNERIKSGADLDEAERLLTMPTAKRAAAVIKRGLKATRDDDGQDRDVSGGRPAKELPKPIRPVRDRGGRHEEIAPDDPERANKLSMADWMARRQAQVDAKNPRKRAG